MNPHDLEGSPLVALARLLVRVHESEAPSPPPRIGFTA